MLNFLKTAVLIAVNFYLKISKKLTEREYLLVRNERERERERKSDISLWLPYFYIL